MELLVIMFWLFGLMLLYLVIKWAIDDSKTAKNIQAIRNILSDQYTGQKDNTNNSPKLSTGNEFDITNVSIDKCPACNSKITGEDKECPSCGLVLSN